jgi:hypothetical protein
MGNSSNKGKGFDPAMVADDWKGDKVDVSLASNEAEETSKLPPIDIFTITVCIH